MSIFPFAHGVKNNFGAVVGPTVNDDASEGYSQGSGWINSGVSPAQIFILADATLGAANWINVTDSGGDMLKAVYDTNDDGIVDNALDLGLRSDYVYASDNTTQTVSVANTFQTITFNGLTLNGWGHVAGLFTNTENAIWQISYVFFCHRTGGTPIFEARCLDTVSGEIRGSQSSQTLGSNNPDGVLTQTFFLTPIPPATPSIRFEFTASVGTANIAPAGANATFPVGGSVIIRKIT